MRQLLHGKGAEALIVPFYPHLDHSTLNFFSSGSNSSNRSKNA